MKINPLLLCCLLMATPAPVQAQFKYATNNGTITIRGYIGTNGAVVIPDTITGLPVTAIGDYGFDFNTNLTSVIIPNSLTSIGKFAFLDDISLTGITIPNSVTNIGDSAFFGCTSLTAISVETNNPAYSSLSGVLFNESQTTLIEYPGGKIGSYSIPSSVTAIATNAFSGLTNLANITIPSSITNIGTDSFATCGNLTGVYFAGNAPGIGSDVFYHDYNAAAYYLPGTTGWGSTFGGIPTALWTLPSPLILTSTPSFGVQTNQFGFIISWATNLSVVVEAASDLANPVWSPVQTNTLTSGAFYFSDPQWTNFSSRFYRIRSQ